MSMAGSRKNNPVRGMTTASSEKKDKELYNRRFRRISKQALHVNPGREVLPTCGNTATLGAWTRMAKCDSIQRNILNGCANDGEDIHIAYTCLI
jgi:hypothetical protein